MMAFDLTALAAGFALLAPVYGLLFQIQHKLGRFETEIRVVKEKVDENETAIENENELCP